jgi:Zn-dependent protease with chaperone function
VILRQHDRNFRKHYVAEPEMGWSTIGLNIGGKICKAALIVVLSGTLCALFVDRVGRAANSAVSGAPPTSPAQATGAVTNEPAEAKNEVKTFTLPPEKYKQAVEFARAKYRLYPIEVVGGVLVLCAILHFGVATRFRDWAEATSSRRFVQVLVYTPLLLVTLGVLGLPGDIYRQWLELKYQQSVESWSSWSLDWIKSGVISLVLGILLVWILYGVIRRSPRSWWLYFWMVSIPILIFLVFLQPLVVDPLFFRFRPLAARQPVLAAEITKVVERAGLYIPPERMFEMEASTKLKSLNAYVTGLGASKRVVVWDTTVARLTVPETLSVFGHELGHYVLGHIVEGIVFSLCVIFLFSWLGARGLAWSLERVGPRWRMRGADDWASLPLLLLFLSVLTFLGTPAFNAFSRYLEHQADVYGLEVIHGLVPDSPQAAARSFQVMGEVDLEDPDPSRIVEFWLFSHPSVKERIDFALHYDPWSKGLAPQFVRTPASAGKR